MTIILQRATQKLQRQCAAAVSAGGAAPYIYHPLKYAWQAHKAYLQRYGSGRKKAIFVGMNPGPWGMGQTGIPFGDVVSVRDYLGITAKITAPQGMHPKVPVQGLACKRQEISGKRLWELFQQRYGSSEEFFADHYVANYCPVLFLTETGANLTPDKLPAAQTAALYTHCDAYLKTLASEMQPEAIIGIGDFVQKRLVTLFPPPPKIGKILHPSPASPKANKSFAATATQQLKAIGI